MKFDSFAHFFKDQPLSEKDFCEKHNFSKNTIQSLKKGERLEQKEIQTYLKLARAYPKVNWKHIFPFLREF